MAPARRRGMTNDSRGPLGRTQQEEQEDSVPHETGGGAEQQPRPGFAPHHQAPYGWSSEEPRPYPGPPGAHGPQNHGPQGLQGQQPPLGPPAGPTGPSGPSGLPPGPGPNWA